MLVISFCGTLAGSEGKELGVKIERNVPVPMRDGTILRADIHRPDRGGPYPVLIQRTPYGKDGSFDQFVKAGYLVVSQDARGRYKSDGIWESFYRSKTHDAVDGYDTVEWAAKLPRSTGKIGTFGGSYNAFLQWRLAPLRPPSLICMSTFVGGAAKLTDVEGPGGIRPGIRPQWWTIMAPDMRRRENVPGVHAVWEAQKLWQKDRERWISWLPWSELPSDFFGYETEAAKKWLRRPNVDPWKLDEGIKEIAVPNLEITGWYDHGLGDLLLFRTMVKEAKTEVARSGSRIIIGPWGHSRPASSFGNIDFGPDSFLNMTALQIRWFDYWLKGIQNGVQKDPPIKIFIMGDNQWRDEHYWPLRRTKQKVLYLTSNGNANTPKGQGRLVTDEPEFTGMDHYLYDPKNPVPTPHGTARPIAVDQRSLAEREDILVYQTEPLGERLEVTGNPIVELYASSSARDTDWFVRLIDVHPGGLGRDVSMGMVRARYRDGLAKPSLVAPGEVVKYTIRMRPTSNAFLPGHRVRLDITSSDFPWYDRNHNTETDHNADATLVTARQTIYHGGERQTCIFLPWVTDPKGEEKPIVEVRPETKKQTYPLHQAAADGNIDQVKALLSKGANKNARDDKKATPLCRAVESGKMEIVELFVEAGADVNAGSWPPLCVAVDENNIIIAKYLIAHGANVNAPESWASLQETPYIDNNIEMVKLLIANGADINAGPYTALHAAVSEGRKDLAKLLIQKGADINVEDSRGKTPLDYAFSGNRIDIARLLLERTTDFTSKDKQGLTALHYAAVNGFQDTTELLLGKGAKVDGRDDDYEFTPMHYAARFGNKNVVEVLIAHGADIKAKDKWDYQPIHWAAYHDRPEIIELLIAKGADVNAKTSLGQTPLGLAKPRRNTAAIEVLLKHGSND